MNIQKIPYKHLTLFVIGCLLSVVISFFITEKFLSSSGFEYRQNVYNCLVDYLKERNVSDDYFPSSEPESNGNDETHVNCSVILKQFNVLKDMESNLYSSYNITTKLCTELMADNNMKLCLSSNDVKGSDNQSRDKVGVEEKKRSCFDIEKYFTDDEISKYETPETLFISSRNYCTDADECSRCVKEILTATDDYENTMLHAKAVNITIIDVKVWNYFMISKRVHELLDEAQSMVDDAVSDCKTDQKCNKLLQK